jgi:Icc-related predicted phosphoesterase
MKFLLIGDFHGRIHPKLNKIKKLDFDYILCNGDLPSDGGSRKYIFKYWKELDEKPLEEIIGKKKYNEMVKISNNSVYMPLEFMNFFSKIVYLVRGNFDLEHNLKGRKSLVGRLSQRIKKYKNIKLVSAKIIKRKEFTLIMNSGYRFVEEKEKKIKYKERNILWDKRLKRIFSKVENFDNSIFLVHDPPLNHLDKVLFKKSPMYGKNLGDEYYLKYIKKYQPTVCVCGHMHEHSQKTSKIGKTLVVNPGEADKGQFAILELKNNKTKIKFYR